MGVSIMGEIIIVLIGGGIAGWLVSRFMPQSTRTNARVVLNIVLGSIISLLIAIPLFNWLMHDSNVFGSEKSRDTVLLISMLISWVITCLILIFAHKLLVRRVSISSLRTMAHPRGVHIFISYRREDTGGYAGRIFDRLSRLVGRERVFMDIDTIEPGIDFADAIQQAVSACDILLVLIGPAWLRSADASGQRRLDNPEDFVRLELVTALERDIRIIPVLVEETKMPDADDLPEPLKRLTRRNALQISNTRWSYDIERIIDIVKRVAPGSPT